MPQESRQPSGPPSALAGAMMKDKKPFTYTPGGLDLSEIKSERMQRRLFRNAQSEGIQPTPTSPHSSPSPSTGGPSTNHLGMPILVLPMPGAKMAGQQKSQSQPPPTPPQEIPQPKRNVCGPAPLPPPFVVNSNSLYIPSTPPPMSPPAMSPPIMSPPIMSPPVMSPPAVMSPPVMSPPAVMSPPMMSSTPIDFPPAAVQPQLSKVPGPTIPVAPPLPPQGPRRGSLILSPPPVSSLLVNHTVSDPLPPPLPPPQPVRVPITPPITLDTTPRAPVKEVAMELQRSPTPTEEEQFSEEEEEEELMYSEEEEEEQGPVISSNTPLSRRSSITEPYMNLLPLQTSVVDYPVKEPLFEPQMPLKEPSPAPQMPIREPSPDPIREPSPEPFREPSPVLMKEPSPMPHMPIKEPSPAPVKEPSPMPQMPVKEPSPAPPMYRSASKEPSPLRQFYKELSPLGQFTINDPSSLLYMSPAPIKEPTPPPLRPRERTPLDYDILCDRTPSRRNSLFDSMTQHDSTVIFAPPQIKQMPSKEPTPVRQIVREPTPVRQAKLQQPVTPPAPLKIVEMPKPPEPLIQPPVQNHLAQPSPAQTPVKTMPMQPPPAQTPIKTMPMQPTPAQTPVKTMPMQPPPTQTPIKTMPMQATPAQTPVKTMPMQPPPTQIPIKTMPMQATPAQTPIKPMPMQPPPTQTPIKTMHMQPSPAQTPVKTTPTQSAPSVQHTIPAQTPVKTTPMQPTLRAQMPIKTTPVQPAPSVQPTLPAQTPIKSTPAQPLYKRHSMPSEPTQITYIPVEKEIPQASSGPAPSMRQIPVKVQPQPAAEVQPAATTPQVTRQSSQPTKTSPPQVNQVMSTPVASSDDSSSSAMSPLSERSGRLSPTSGLIRAPLPWMTGHPRDLSPPPRFVTQAQQAQNRIQSRVVRQRSVGPGLETSLSKPIVQHTAPVQPQAHQFQRQRSLPPPQRPQAQAAQPHLVKIQPSLGPVHAKQPSQLQQPTVRNIPIKVQPVPQAQHIPRERIIPISIERDSPPRQAPHNAKPNAAYERIIPVKVQGVANTSIQNSQHTQQRPAPSYQKPAAPQQQFTAPQPQFTAPQPQFTAPQQQQSWTTSPGTAFSPPQYPATPQGGSQGGGAFVPYNSDGGLQSNNSAFEALQQMKQSLEQLNSGLETAFPRFIQKKMSDSITPRKQPSAQNHPQQNGTANGGDYTPIQSRAFRVLQNVLDHQDTAEPQGPVHIPSINPNLQNPHQFQHQPTPQHFQQPTAQHFQQPDGVGVSIAAEAPPEPKKYMGGNIPSRSFRMLQAMTADDDDVAGPGQSDL